MRPPLLKLRHLASLLSVLSLSLMECSAISLTWQAPANPGTPVDGCTQSISDTFTVQATGVDTDADLKFTWTIKKGPGSSAVVEKEEVAINNDPVDNSWTDTGAAPNVPTNGAGPIPGKLFKDAGVTYTVEVEVKQTKDNPDDPNNPFVETSAPISRTVRTVGVTAITFTVNGNQTNETWPHGCVASEATCDATTLPPGRQVTWSIVGTKHGADFKTNPANVLMTSLNQSGTITVRATDSSCSNATFDKELTIRGVPHQWQASTKITTGLPPATYGGQWQHTFSSTGGSLTGVKVTETVTAGTSSIRKYDNTLFIRTAISYGASIWIFTSADTFEWDAHWCPETYVDAHYTVNVPASYTRSQQYHWFCPLHGPLSSTSPAAHVTCTGYGPSALTRTLAGNCTTFQTSADGETITDNYVGPTRLRNVQFNPATLVADGQSTTQASVQTALPSGRQYKWMPWNPWNAAGTTIAEGGLISAGNTPGTITVRAYSTYAPTRNLDDALNVQAP